MGRTGKVRSSSRGRKRGKRSVKQVKKCKEDRISQLSDDLINHILSYVDSNVAVQTMVLSKRWLNLWTTLSCLNFKQPVSGNYENFVSNFLENRDQQSVLSKFSFDCYPGARRILTICLDYALYHNVEHLSICCGDLADYPCRINFACIKTLHLKCCENLRMLNFWTLPSLTSFYLKTYGIGDQILGFENLKELTLDVMVPEKPVKETFTINCPKLQSLTLKTAFRHKFIVSAPNLCYLSYRSRYVSDFSTRDGFPCIKQVHIDIRNFFDLFDSSDWLFGLWQFGSVNELAMKNFISMLKAVKETPFLELSSETITGLRMISNLSEYEPPSLGNLNFISLRGAGLFDLRPPRSTEYVINYLLTNSPGAKIIRKL